MEYDKSAFIVISRLFLTTGKDSCNDCSQRRRISRNAHKAHRVRPDYVSSCCDHAGHLQWWPGCKQTGGGAGWVTRIRFKKPKKRCSGAAPDQPACDRRRSRLIQQAPTKDDEFIGAKPTKPCSRVTPKATQQAPTKDDAKQCSRVTRPVRTKDDANHSCPVYYCNYAVEENLRWMHGTPRPCTETARPGRDRHNHRSAI